MCRVGYVPSLQCAELSHNLYVLRWLIRSILALNCLLQMEQQRSEQDSSVGDALALALRCARFCSASLILVASYSLAPLLMRLRHFARSCEIWYGTREKRETDTWTWSLTNHSSVFVL